MLELGSDGMVGSEEAVLDGERYESRERMPLA